MAEYSPDDIIASLSPDPEQTEAVRRWPVVRRHIDGSTILEYDSYDMRNAFIAGARWMLTQYPQVSGGGNG